MHSQQPYDMLIRANPERLKDYNQFCGLFDNWLDEMNYLSTLMVESDSTEDEEMVQFSLNSVKLKYRTLTASYMDKYCSYKVGDVVQITKNNRITYVGTIAHIEIARNATHIDDFLKGKKRLSSLPTKSPTTTKETNIRYAENEFLYIIVVTENKHVIKQFIFRIEEGVKMLPMSSKTVHQCPICETENKPMVDSIIGGTSVIICMDCDRIIRDIFGNEYTTKMLNYRDLKNLPAHKTILNYSQYR